MGSIPSRCAISGLPISSGDSIYYLLLTGNRVERAHHACYITDWCFPRTLPLRASYDDYGSVENLEEGLVQASWLEGLRKDLVESVEEGRKPARSRTMSLEDLLRVLKYDHIQVKMRHHPLRPNANRLSHAMILEEVWQELLRYGDLEARLEEARAFYESCLAFNAKMKGFFQAEKFSAWGHASSDRREELGMSDSRVISLLYGRNGSEPWNSMGGRDHWEQFVEKGLTLEQAQPFLSRLAEMTVVQDEMDLLGIQWVPSAGTGEYSPDYNKLARFHRACAGIMETKEGED